MVKYDESIIPEVKTGENYEKIQTNIPLEQPLLFFLDNLKAFYLPRESTVDENTHTYPQDVLETLTKKRILQPAFIRQGEAGLTKFEIIFRNAKGYSDLTGLMIRFEGRTSNGALVVDDEGFDTSKGGKGIITWTPTDAVGMTAGQFKSAHFVIETPDRTNAQTTLEFSMQVIPNDIAFPREMAFYISEYQRALFHIKEMQDASDEAINYMIQYCETVLLAYIGDAQTKLYDLNKKISEIDSKADTLNDKLVTSEKEMTDKIDELLKAIKDNNVITESDAKQIIQDILSEQGIETDDVIQDTTIKNKIDQMISDLNN